MGYIGRLSIIGIGKYLPTMINAYYMLTVWVCILTIGVLLGIIASLPKEFLLGWEKCYFSKVNGRMDLNGS